MIANNAAMFIGIALILSLFIAGIQIYFGYRVFAKGRDTNHIIEYGKFKVTTGSSGVAVMALAVIWGIIAFKLTDKLVAISTDVEATNTTINLLKGEVNPAAANVMKAAGTIEPDLEPSQLTAQNAPVVREAITEAIETGAATTGIVYDADNVTAHYNNVGQLDYVESTLPDGSDSKVILKPVQKAGKVVLEPTAFKLDIMAAAKPKGDNGSNKKADGKKEKEKGKKKKKKAESKAANK